MRFISLQRLYQTLFAGLLLLLLAAAPAPASVDFTGWHLPLPAGVWRIARGPCGSAAPYSHVCGYYEDACGLDLIATTGSLTGTPILAPQAGQVFFLGVRDDSGLTILLRHADGRVSALMHLLRTVVALDEQVRLGQVLGYAGNTGSSSNPHLHFHIQPNMVERTCLDLTGLDGLQPRRSALAVSANRAWSELTLPDPPAQLPAGLAIPPAGLRPGAWSAPAEVDLAPGVSVSVPVGLRTEAGAAARLNWNGRALLPALSGTGYAIFLAPLAGQSNPFGADGPPLTVRLRASADSTASAGLLLLNPRFVGPASYSRVRQPKLCWETPAEAGQAPIVRRVLVVGPRALDSGWQSEDCWSAPADLPAGTYLWKVFLRDARGYQNRTNQRPYAFVIP